MHPPKIKNFRQLWKSAFLTKLTDGGQKILLPFIALSFVNDAGSAAHMYTFTTLGWPTLGLILGVMVDRFWRRSILFWCHTARALLFAQLAFIVYFGSVNLYHLYTAAFIFSIFDIIYAVSLPKIVLDLTTTENRIQNNTRLSATHTVCGEFLGPGLGAALSLYDPVIGFATIALFYAMSAKMLSFLLNTSSTATRGTRRLSITINHFSAPGMWLLKNKMLLILAFVEFGLSLSWGAWYALEPYFLIKTTPVTSTKLQFGFLMGGLAFGAAFASWALERIKIGRRSLIPLFIDAGGTVCLLVISSYTKHLFFVGCALFIAGIGMTVWASIVLTLRQELVPTYLMGGVNGIFRVFMYGGCSAGSVLGGLFASRLSVPNAYVFIIAISGLFCPLIFLANRLWTRSLS